PREEIVTPCKVEKEMQEWENIIRNVQMMTLSAQNKEREVQREVKWILSMIPKVLHDDLQSPYHQSGILSVDQLYLVAERVQDNVREMERYEDDAQITVTNFGLFMDKCKSTFDQQLSKGQDDELLMRLKRLDNSVQEMNPKMICMIKRVQRVKQTVKEMQQK